MWVMRSKHNHDVKVGLTTVTPRDQIDIAIITPDIQAAIDKGDVILTFADETSEERKATADLFTPNFRTGNKAIDGYRHLATRNR